MGSSSWKSKFSSKWGSITFEVNQNIKANQVQSLFHSTYKKIPNLESSIMGKANMWVGSGEQGFFILYFIISCYHGKGDLLPWVIFLKKNLWPCMDCLLLWAEKPLVLWSF